jgi:replicative DNA helicase
MLVAGRLGTGKSTIVQAITKHFWEQGLKILFVSAEMLPADVFARIDAMIGAFNPLDLRKPKTTTMEGLLDAVHSVVSEEDGEIVVPKSRMMTPASIGTFARNLGADLIIVDGAYLLRPSSGHFSSKWERVATVSNELKQLALDLEVPMIGTVQIKRGAGGKDTYDPEDIALSDALGQDADFVLAINPSSVVEGSSELQLIKNRFGSTCTTRISTDFSTMKITETSLPKVGADEEDWKSWVKS